MSKAIVPIPRCDVSVRVATSADVPFIDSLQKMHAKQVGFLRASWIEGKIAKGQVLVAEETQNAERRMQNEEGASSQFCDLRSDFCVRPLGYIISQDKYLMREELGLVVQLCVAPGAQRKLIGATLLRAAFEHASYGCTLFCCWCAQDIEANRFWESMGFVPLAYRGGSKKTLRRRSGQAARVHIFWQKRIREGDTETKWWYPTETRGGAMGEARIVFPIPPDRHWSDEMPVILPACEATPKALPGPREARARSRPAPKRRVVGRAGTLFFTPPPIPKAEKPKPEKKPRVKNDPKLVAAARELRDKWLERLNGGGVLLESGGKYDVARVLPSGSSPLLLPHAA